PAPLVDRRHHGDGVARQLVGDLVADLAGVLVEGDDAAAVALDLTERDLVALGRAAADLGDEQVALDHRRAADPAEVLHRREVLHAVQLPDDLAVRDAQTVQHPLRAADVDAVAVDDRVTARAVAVVVHVLVVAQITVLPEQFARLALEAAEPTGVAQPIED